MTPPVVQTSEWTKGALKAIRDLRLPEDILAEAKVVDTTEAGGYLAVVRAAVPFRPITEI